jgi:enamine deaminase RidA (YjgF/YER057c/UK114 family)
VIELVRPEGWADPVGYADAVAARGRVVFVAGQIGWDPATRAFASDDFASQTRQALSNVSAALRAAGAEPRHLVRLTWFVTSKAEYRAARRELRGAYRDVIGDHYPAMSLVVVTALLEDRAKVEIEATAMVPE